MVAHRSHVSLAPFPISPESPIDVAKSSSTNAISLVDDLVSAVQSRGYICGVVEEPIVRVGRVESNGNAGVVATDGTAHLARDVDGYWVVGSQHEPTSNSSLDGTSQAGGSNPSLLYHSIADTSSPLALSNATELLVSVVGVGTVRRGQIGHQLEVERQLGGLELPQMVHTIVDSVRLRHGRGRDHGGGRSGVDCLIVGAGPEMFSLTRRILGTLGSTCLEAGFSFQEFHRLLREGDGRWHLQ